MYECIALRVVILSTYTEPGMYECIALRVVIVSTYTEPGRLCPLVFFDSQICVKRLFYESM